MFSLWSISPHVPNPWNKQPDLQNSWPDEFRINPSSSQSKCDLLKSQFPIAWDCWFSLVVRMENGIQDHEISAFIYEYANKHKLSPSRQVVLRYQLTAFLAEFRSDKQLAELWKVSGRGIEGLAKVLVEALSGGLPFSRVHALLQIIGLLSAKMTRQNECVWLVNCGQGNHLLIESDLIAAFEAIQGCRDIPLEEALMIGLLDYFQPELGLGRDQLLEAGANPALLGILVGFCTSLRSPHLYLLGHFLYEAYSRGYPNASEQRELQQKLVLRLPSLITFIQGHQRTAFLRYVAAAVEQGDFKELQQSIMELPKKDADLHWMQALMHARSPECKRMAVLLWEASSDPSSQIAKGWIRSPDCPFGLAFELFRKLKMRSAQEHPDLIRDLWDKRSHISAGSDDFVAFYHFLIDFCEAPQIHIAALSQPNFLSLMECLHSGIARFTYFVRYGIDARKRLTDAIWRNHWLSALRMAINENKKGEVWKLILYAAQKNYLGSLQGQGQQEFKDLLIAILPEFSQTSADLLKQLKIQALSAEQSLKAYDHLNALIEGNEPLDSLQKQCELWLEYASGLGVRFEALVLRLIRLGIAQGNGSFALKWFQYLKKKPHEASHLVVVLQELMPLLKDVEIDRTLDKSLLSSFTSRDLFIACEQLINETPFKEKSFTKLLATLCICDEAEPLCWASLMKVMAASQPRLLSQINLKQSKIQQIVAQLREDNAPGELLIFFQRLPASLNFPSVYSDLAWCIESLIEHTPLDTVIQLILISNIDHSHFKDSVKEQIAAYLISTKHFVTALPWVFACTPEYRVSLASLCYKNDRQEEARSILDTIVSGAFNELQQFLLNIEVKKAPEFVAYFLLRQEEWSLPDGLILSCLDALLELPKKPIHVIDQLLLKYKVLSLDIWERVWMIRGRKKKATATLLDRFLLMKISGVGAPRSKHYNCWLALVKAAAGIDPSLLTKIFAAEIANALKFTFTVSEHQDKQLIDITLAALDGAIKHQSLEGLDAVNRFFLGLFSLWLGGNKPPFSDATIQYISLRLAISMLECRANGAVSKIRHLFSWISSLTEIPTEIHSELGPLMTTITNSTLSPGHLANIISGARAAGLDKKVLCKLANQKVVLKLLNSSVLDVLTEGKELILLHLSEPRADREFIENCIALNFSTWDHLIAQMDILDHENAAIVLGEASRLELRKKLFDRGIANFPTYGVTKSYEIVKKAIVQPYFLKHLLRNIDNSFLDALFWVEATQDKNFNEIGPEMGRTLLPVLDLLFEKAHEIDKNIHNIFTLEKPPEAHYNTHLSLRIATAICSWTWLNVRLGLRVHMLLANWYVHLFDNDFYKIEDPDTRDSINHLLCMTWTYLSIYADNEEFPEIIQQYRNKAGELGQHILKWEKKRGFSLKASVIFITTKYCIDRFRNFENQAEATSSPEMMRDAINLLTAFYHPKAYTYIFHLMERLNPFDWPKELPGWFTRMLNMYLQIPGEAYIRQGLDRQSLMSRLSKILFEYDAETHSEAASAFQECLKKTLNVLLERIDACRESHEDVIRTLADYYLILQGLEPGNWPKQENASLWAKRMVEKIKPLGASIATHVEILESLVED